MDELSYPQCTRELYESEILGESLFLALVEQAKSPRDRYHLGTLLQLESETKARLRPLLFKHGVSLSEETDLSILDVAIKAYEEMTWQDYMGVNVPVVQEFLDKFKAIAEIGDADDKEILESMVTHEAAILRWATMESTGPKDDSLDDVTVQLKYPLPASGER
jgi:hypothetical protein